VKLVSTGVYDQRQQQLALELLRAIKEALVEVDTPPELVKQLTGDIGFAVTAILDDSRSFEAEDGGTLSPMVTFLVGDEQLEFGGGNSWMHEYVYGLLPDLFPEEQARDANG
jgi:hypothetical protein